MADFSDYLENQILDTFYPDGATYLALYTVAPTDAGGGTEVSGSAYVRKAIPFASPAAAGSKASTGVVSFTALGGGFGEVIHGGIFDAATGGNFLAHHPIIPITINDGDTLDFPAGSIVVGQD